MSHSYALGMFWLLIAGVMQGAFPLPMKFTLRWKFEHLWFWYSLFAFIVLPLITALVTVHRLGDVYTGLNGWSVVGKIVCFGLTWGVGSVMYGLGIDSLGMTLGFPIMTALTTALGALVPLVILTPDLIWQRNGILVMAGNVVTLVGVVACSVAGGMRDKQLGREFVPAILGPSRSFSSALWICIIAGVLSAMFNFGYAFGEPVVQAAMKLGSSRDDSQNAVWLLMLPAGGLINVGWCLRLCQRNASFGLLRRGAIRDWGSSLSMAVMWTGSVFVYGWGANLLGRLGPTLGWSVWNAILLVTTVACGLFTHEWDGIRGRPIYWLIAGIGILIAGTSILGQAGS